jgi:hypothetical protein
VSFYTLSLGVCTACNPTVSDIERGDEWGQKREKREVDPAGDGTCTARTMAVMSAKSKKNLNKW